MTESPDSVSQDGHESGVEDHHTDAGKAGAVKDKECPYCQQKFTSSSLGRHLDQFIHKKKPDGIHNVDEIKRLRSSITRRTARGGKKDHADGTSSRPSPAPHSTNLHRHDVLDLIDQINATPPGGVSMQINRANWHTTGVITDAAQLNPSPTLPATNPLPAVSASPSSKKRSFATYASDLSSPTYLAETARALELSLREILDSLRAASKHASPQPSPFDFDIHSQSFPSLCLQLLPTPPTLHQASPFSTLNTCPIAAPGLDQVNALRTAIIRKIDLWKWEALRLAQRTTTNIADEADFLGRQAQSYDEAAMKHLDSAYQNWMVHPPETRNAIWHVELLRAFQSEKNRASNIEEEMHRLQQEANNLQQQVEYLSLCQWPREMALWPPERHTFGKKMSEELRLLNPQKPAPKVEGESEEDYMERLGPGGGENVNTRADKWDFDKLVNKWRAHVREDKHKRGLTAPFIQPPKTEPPGGGGSNFGGDRAGAGGSNANAHGLALKDPGMIGIIPDDIKRAKAESDIRNVSNGDSPVNGIVNMGDDGKEQGERRAPRRNLPKNISIISDL